MLKQRDHDTVEALLANSDFVYIAQAVSTSSQKIALGLNLARTSPAYWTIDVNGEELDEILKDARHDGEVYDALNRWVAARWKRDGELPERLQKWVQSILFGVNPRPTVSGLTRAAFGRVRNEFLARLVRMASHHGYVPTRNEASSEPSASDIVVEALSRIGIHLSYSVVARAWWTAKPQEDDAPSETHP